MTERQAIVLKDRYSRKLLERPEVCGVGVTRDKDSKEYVVSVLLAADETPELRQQIADDLEGHPFTTIVTGPFKLLRGGLA